MVLHPLTSTVRLRARRADISAVTVNGKPSKYTVEPGINCTVGERNHSAQQRAQVEIVYGTEDLPQAKTPNTGVAGKSCTVSVDRGRIQEVRHGSHKLGRSDISANGTACTIPLPSEAGVTTFFVRVTHRNVKLWVPVEVNAQAATSVAKSPAKPHQASATTIDLKKYRNQRLEDLHKNTYKPLVSHFYWANRPGLRHHPAQWPELVGRPWTTQTGYRHISAQVGQGAICIRQRHSVCRTREWSRRRVHFSLR